MPVTLGAASIFSNPRTLQGGPLSPAAETLGGDAGSVAGAEGF